MDDKMQRELMSKLAELESKHKRRLPQDDIHLRLRRDMDRAQKDTPVISKELFCTAIHLLKEQESIDDEFGRALQKVGNGHFAYGTENKYREALLMVLRNAINDQYDYIDWWLYEGAPDYKMKFDAAEVSQIIIRYDGMYRRCIRAKFTDLCYEGIKGDWRPIGSVLFGNASVIEFNIDTGTFETLLYVQEDSSDTKEQLEAKLGNPDEIILDRICDEVFGDG